MLEKISVVISHIILIIGIAMVTYCSFADKELSIFGVQNELRFYFILMIMLSISMEHNIKTFIKEHTMQVSVQLPEYLIKSMKSILSQEQNILSQITKTVTKEKDNELR